MIMRDGSNQSLLGALGSIAEKKVFQLSFDSEDQFKVKVSQDQFMNINSHSEVDCGPDSSSFFLTPVAEDSSDKEGYFIEEISKGPHSKFLSTQLSDSPTEVRALISLESFEDMRQAAKAVGDKTSAWSLECQDDLIRKNDL